MSKPTRQGMDRIIVGNQILMLETLKTLKQNLVRLKNLFYTQKATANQRKIPFLLTFEEWLKIWINSGHLHERGKHKNQYCMARFEDEGPYAVGNVKIILTADNTRESRPSMLGKNHTQETRKRMSEIAKNRGRIGWKRCLSSL